MRRIAGAGLILLAFAAGARAQDEPHEHAAPEKLGVVSFATTCAPESKARFDRAVALLHSFAYSAADDAFREVETADPRCAMARWGRAMTYFHQLWEPAVSSVGLQKGRTELEAIPASGETSARESEYIAALSLVYRAADSIPISTRIQNYADAMGVLASRHSEDSEAQVFYALALLATAPPDDKSHRNQKKAAALLEQLYHQQPEHPGIVHYLIHAYDNAELAPRGLVAARAYASLAPSAPHALHMPSHIFTRLGMWSESIRSNLAARAAAHAQGDIGEELHAMDYLVYAYLQSGRTTEAAAVIAQLRDMPALRMQDFKVGYAATAMPVRYAVERQEWAESARSTAGDGAPPHVAAIAAWARALGDARGGDPQAATAEVDTLRALEDKLQLSGNKYWAGQVHIQFLEASAWLAHAEGKADEAFALLRSAADEEDAIEKLPVTPGPVVPAREQLGELLLKQGHPRQALTEFESSLRATPRRRGGLEGALRAAQLSGDRDKERMYRQSLEQTEN